MFPESGRALVKAGLSELCLSKTEVGLGANQRASREARIVAFERQPERELMSWVARHFASLGKRVTPELCRYLISICGASMTSMDA